MDAPQKAMAALKNYDKKGGTIHIDLANAHAAIAQAEQLKRIADLLDRGLTGTAQSPIETWVVVDGLRQRID